MRIEILQLILILFLFSCYFIFDGSSIGAGIVSGFLLSNSTSQLLYSLLPFWDQNETWLLQGILVSLCFSVITSAKAINTFFVPMLLFAMSLFVRGCLLEIKGNALEQPKLLVFCLNTLWMLLLQHTIINIIFSGVMPLHQPADVFKTSSLSSTMLFYIGAGYSWLSLRANMMLLVAQNHASHCFSLLSFIEETFISSIVLKHCVLNRGGLLPLTIQYSISMLVGASLSFSSHTISPASILMRGLIAAPRYTLVVWTMWSRGLPEVRCFRRAATPLPSLFLMNVLLIFLPITFSYIVYNVRTLGGWRII